MKKLFLELVALLVLFPAQNALAQTGAKAGSGKLMSQIERLVKDYAPKKKSGVSKLISSRQIGQPATSAFQRLQRNLKVANNRSPRATRLLTTDTGTEIWGNVIYANSWTSSDAHQGVYSWTSKSTTMTELAAPSDGIRADGGGAFYDGKFHFLTVDDTDYGYFVTYNVYDTNTWKEISGSNLIDDAGMVAVSTAYDPTTGKIYACAQTTDRQSLQLAQLSYETMTKTVINKDLSGTVYIAMACDKNGVLYALNDRGTLLTLNKETGEETEIGSTYVYPETLLQSMAFDYSTGDLYWASQESNNTAYFYKIDVTNGYADYLGQFSDGEEIVCLYIPQAVSSDVPAKVTDLAATFAEGSNTGTVTFTMPTKTVGGDDLTGSLSYTVYANGKVVAEGTANAGAAISKSITAEDGEQLISVIVKNDKGESERAKITVWVGLDLPMPATNVKLVVDEKTGLATLTWDAPTAGTHGGYIDVSKVIYTVHRVPDNKTVKTGLYETTYSETLPDTKLTAYYYSVTAQYNGKSSDAAYSNKVVYGQALDVPYYENFDTQAGFDIFTIIDANNDSSTWEYAPVAQNVFYRYNSVNKADDWLITPAINLYPNTEYTFRYRAMAGSYVEKMAVAMGEGLDPTAYKTIAEESQVPSASTMFTHKVTVETEGQYHFAFHALSEANQFRIYIDSISVTTGLDKGVPGPATNLTVVPEATGELQAQISFNAPDTTVGGETLTDLTLIELYRGDDLIQTYNNPTPGEAISYTDNSPVNGNNTYTVRVYNSVGEGVKAEVTAFVGVDVPIKPQNVTLKDNLDGTATLTWTAPRNTGYNGGYVNVDKLTYTIWSVDEEGYVTEAVSNIGIEPYTTTIATTGDQKQVYFAVTAHNAAGRSTFGVSNIIIEGANYPLNFHEGFPAGKTENKFWAVDYTGLSGFGLTDSYSSDGDNGCALFIANEAGDLSSLSTGKIDISTAANPKLVFEYYNLKGADVTLYVGIEKNGEYAGITMLDKISYASSTDEDGWQTAVVDLNGYKDSKYVRLIFTAEVNNTYYPVLIDNINVRDVKANDLEIKFMEVPQSVQTGEQFDINIIVGNVGEQAASDYSVEFTKGDSVTTIPGAKTLQPNKTDTITIACTASKVDLSDITIKATVNYAPDEALDNNETEVKTIKVIAPELPVVDDLQAEFIEGEGVKLTWTAPNTDNAYVTENFDSYDAFLTTGIGEWTLVDGDGSATYGFQGDSFDHMGEAMAYITFDTDKAGISTSEYPQWKARSGNNFLACFAATSGQNDDWLISPILTGKEQTITFWAKSWITDYGKEKFEVRYSTAGNDTTDFKTVLATQEVGSAWTKYEFQLPEGATYFAIRCISQDCFILMIDDITYASDNYEITGYNIYRDGVLIGTTTASELSYLDTEVGEGVHTYVVTVNYTVGESGPSNEAKTSVSGIEDLLNEKANSADGPRFNIAGQRVGKNYKGVIIQNGKKLIVR